ncbi:MAG: cytochrome c peroxidase [Thermodesulfobacteriota bacterium]|nr:cytochrome c peroxidase [Thermodesulfobacteriota bacterium]
MRENLSQFVWTKKLLAIGTALFLMLGMVVSVGADTTVLDKTAQVALGEKLYNDANLSFNTNQSCATCHNPGPPPVVGSFIDDRLPVQDLIDSGWPAAVPPPVSQGSDPSLFGGRNTPSAAYAAFSPAFRFDEVVGLYVGGQFWDGREMSLAGQAAGPFRNSVEMAMADKSAVVSALQLDPGGLGYQVLFAAAYETEDGLSFILSDVGTNNQAALEAYDLMAKAIGEFEKTQLFNKFNSKYDYFLAGLETLTDDEYKGLKLFEGKAKCALCHISQPSIAPDGGPMPPLFTDYTYDNLGVPYNKFIDILNGPQPPDFGLGGVLLDPAQNGKFKVMSLRNIEITAPYGHNGVFQTLEQIVHFYNTRDVLPACNINLGNMDPGFGVTCWPDAEVPANMNVAELGDLSLSAKHEQRIVAFLKTLTDRDLTAFPSVFDEAAFPPMP